MVSVSLLAMEHCKDAYERLILTACSVSADAEENLAMSQELIYYKLVSRALFC